VLGFSDIGKVVRWRPELVLEETADEENPDKPVTRVLQSRVLVIDSATLPPGVALFNARRNPVATREFAASPYAPASLQA
jgi:hypothetical protein